MANTIDNLKEAFAGESQAFQKYTSFAEKADKDGMPNIARLFRTTCAYHLIHPANIWAFNALFFDAHGLRQKDPFPVRPWHMHLYWFPCSDQPRQTDTELPVAFRCVPKWKGGK